jgi:holliday junction DNA helicase RuvA
MIAGVHGVLEGRTADSVIVDVGGVSLRVIAPTGVLSQVGSPGDRIRLHTHLHVREDALTLFGFLTPIERDLFQVLLGVSGVGPKVAMSLLSAYPADVLQRAIADGDVDLLSRVPGIGRKTASRLVLDLKDKLDLGRAAGMSLSAGDSEVLAALTNLGYTPAEAQAAVQSLPTDRVYSLEERLRLALGFFSRR